MPDYATLVEEQGSVVVKITARKSSVSSDQKGQSPMQQLPEELRRYFEQMPGNPGTPRGHQGQPSTGFGSGFIISSDGYIVTNHHVIEGADDIEVSLQNRQSYAAELIGSDARTDLAVLKVDATDLPVAELGDADSLKVGQWVLAIGSPFGFDYTATQGIVSALSRSLPSNDSNYVPFIQTDVAVNPGNSGGPLFDLDGRVVGVNSQIYTRSGGYMGLSFAIPVDVVKNVVT
ncbi:MAG: S1C family serine protease, partial [Granulosicoccaceae bacterium]